MIENAIRSAVLAGTGVSERLGSKVRPLGVSPLDKRPYVAYLITDRDKFPSLDGESTEPEDWKRVRFELAIYADRYGDVSDLSELIDDKVDGFEGTFDGTEIDVMYDGETPTEQTPIAEGSSVLVYVRVLSYKALYRTVPVTP